MKNIFFLAVLLCASPILAQDMPMIVLPIKSTDLSSAQQSIAQSKVTAMMCIAGYLNSATGALVSIQPELIELAPQTANSGTPAQATVQAELVLTVFEDDGKVVLGTKRKRFSATGKTKQQALSQLMLNIRIGDADIQAFLTGLKPQVQAIYEKNNPPSEAQPAGSTEGH